MAIKQGSDKLNYNITSNTLSKVFVDLEKQIDEHSQTIEALLKIDKKYNKAKISSKLLKNVIENLKSEKLDIQQEQKIVINYNGNPCITLNLCILAILTKNIIILDYSNNWEGINSFLIQTVNNVLKNYKTDNLIHLKENERNDEDKIICIDDINKYNSYLRERNKKVKFYSFNYIDFYSDCDEYEEIEELIQQIAEENQIPIEIYSELETKDAVQMIKNGLGKIVVILTNNKETEHIFEENIKNKKIYINKNPFKENMRLLNKEILTLKNE